MLILKQWNIHFTRIADHARNTTIFFISEEVKQTILNFSQGKVRVFSYQFIMTQYNSVNVKLSNWQLNKLKLGIKNDTEVTLNILSNVIGDSNEETNFPYKLWLTDG